MQLGIAYRKVLPLSHREALYSAAQMLNDNIVDDLVAIRNHSWEAKDSALAGTLPRVISRATPPGSSSDFTCVCSRSSGSSVSMSASHSPASLKNWRPMFSSRKRKGC